MWTDEQIELAAAAAAEKADGGKFVDPLFYKPEHQRFWREVVQTALEATSVPPAAKQSEAPNVSKKEIEAFSDHCVYIRSVSRREGHVGAVAFSRTGDPATGDFSDAKLIRKFGEVPGDLTEL
jgi:hypothetical protein